jgi:hypothetical protein
MKQKFVNALSLALIVAMLFTSAVLADNVVNNVTVGGTDTFTAPGSTTVGYKINTAAAGDPQSGCNASDGSPVTITLSVPAGVTASATSLTFNACNVFQNVTFSSGTPGSYAINVVNIVDSGTGSYNDQADFTLHVNAPAVQNQTINVTTAAPASAVYSSSFNVAATGGGSGNPVVITSTGACTGGGNGTASITMTSGTGTCTVNYNQAGGPGYNAASQVSSNTTAQKANATINVSGYSGAYDGAAHGATGSATGVGGADLSGSLNLGDSFTDVPGGTASWSFSGGTNYNDASGSVAIVISKADAGCLISGYSGVYDGAAHGATGSCSATGQGTLDLGDSFTDVPGGTANWSFTATSNNYNDDAGSVAVEITQAASTVTISCPASVVYNVGAQTPCTAEATGAGMSPVALTVSYSNNTNAGTATATASWNGDLNHTGNNATKNFTIEKADATCTVSGYSGVYDTAFHGATGSCSGIGGENAGTLDLGASFKDVPGGNAAWSFTGNGNYKDQSGTVSIAITKADATCSISGYSGLFDGAAHGASGSCSGIGGENAGTLDLGATFTYPPGGNASWAFTGNGNYKDQSGSVAINIAAWTLKGFYQPVDMGGVYNTVKGGSTVPLKFEVFAGSNELNATSVIKSFVQTKIMCDGTLPTDEIEVVTTGGTSLRYDATAGQFIQNWKTPTGAGTCYKVTMTTLDGSFLQAFFRLK